MKILVIHGPNLNLLGQREPEVYGQATMDSINQDIAGAAKQEHIEVSFFQSNHEGEIVDTIGKAGKDFDGILINPAAYTHTSIAIRDALLGCGIPAVEVHLSNIYKREEFRRHSMTAPACAGVITGFGGQSYLLGFRGLISICRKGSGK